MYKVPLQEFSMYIRNFDSNTRFRVYMLKITSEDYSMRDRVSCVQVYSPRSAFPHRARARAGFSPRNIVGFLTFVRKLRHASKVIAANGYIQGCEKKKGKRTAVLWLFFSCLFDSRAFNAKLAERPQCFRAPFLFKLYILARSVTKTLHFLLTLFYSKLCVLLYVNQIEVFWGAV